jgi:hypothetical protein
VKVCHLGCENRGVLGEARGILAPKLIPIDNKSGRCSVLIGLLANHS